MKKFKRTELRFEKEIVTALTGNELENVKGGIELKTIDGGEACVTSGQIRCKVSDPKTQCFCPAPTREPGCIPGPTNGMHSCIPQTNYKSCQVEM